jgi:SAM-dependent methyltransferase
MAIPLPDHSVDKILAANVAYFWPDIPRVVAELRRVSRPGAKLAIYVTARETMEHWRFADTRTHRHFDVPGLEAALGVAGIMREQIVATRHRLSGNVHAIVALVSL